MTDDAAPRLAPVPDFRYVGFAPAERAERRLATTLASGGAAGLALAVAHAGVGWAAGGTVIATALAAAALRVRRGPARRWGAPGATLGFTPWGLVVEAEHGAEERGHDEGPRALRWAAIDRVHVEVEFGRDGGTPVAKTSNVVVEAGRERFVGRAPGAVPLEAALVHAQAYAAEQAHRVALDLDGAVAGEGPTEPDFEPLLAAVREALESAPASQRLGLPAAGYRGASARGATDETLALLRATLTDRTPHTVDPRPIAAVLAAELGAHALVAVVAPLGQSPHPLLAAVARVAACKLGAPLSKVGTLDEVAPFLLPADLDAIAAWALVPSLPDRSVRSSVG